MLIGLFDDSRAAEADPDKDPRLPKMLEDARVLIDHKKPQAAVEKCDKVIALFEARYRKGKVGDVEVKQKLIAALNRFLEPIRERRARFAAEKGLVEEILSQGTARAREECLQTLSEARDAMGLTYFRGREAIQVLK